MILTTEGSGGMFGWLIAKLSGKKDKEETRDMTGPVPGKRRVCANCGEPYIDGDKYCRFCGAPMGKPEYIEEDFACIYGPPPVKRTHVCRKCGYKWTTEQMIDNERRCPKCGGPAPASEER